MILEKIIMRASNKLYKIKFINLLNKVAVERSLWVAGKKQQESMGMPIEFGLLFFSRTMKLIEKFRKRILISKAFSKIKSFANSL